jgi:cation diffusion facilitator CzcD-associated flavoprotein CzcO
MIEAAIIGAGPYGLSVAAHFRSNGIPFRIFGLPMDSWRRHMPAGMMLKSDGFASNLDDPRGEFPLERFCADQGIEYSDSGIPVRLETFTAYGLAFGQRMVPNLEEKLVVELTGHSEGFCIRLDDGETLEARRVVVATGITHFAHIPANLAHLPEQFLSHSYSHHNLETFKGRGVAVIGGGASATDLAALLHEVGADVKLVCREKSLVFHSKSMGGSRSLWEQIRYPRSGLGPGLKSRFIANSPEIFHFLPESFRLNAARTHLGPAGGWFIKDKVIGRLPVLYGYAPDRAQITDSKVNLYLRSADGSEREIQAEHVIVATGYRAAVERLPFLHADIRARLKTVEDTPVLSSGFESSVRGLYFVGIAATNSFGPVMRFAFGSAFAARRVTSAIAKSIAREGVSTLDRSALVAAK